MSKPSWERSLHRKLADLSRAAPSGRLCDAPRIAIVGIGHELRGDDAAGVMVARTLRQLYGPVPDLPVLVVDAGPAPENYTGPLRRFAPDLVVLIDAAQMHEAPGTIRWLAWPETSGLSASTHTLPPYVLAQYLIDELGCEVALIGIQPADTAIGASLSPVVQPAVNTVAQLLFQAAPSANEPTV